METFCADDPSYPMDGDGTTQDWVSFFWKLYAEDNPSMRFSINEFTEIWSGATFGADFNGIKNAAWAVAGTRYDFFCEMGIECGVDH
jgi:hypothetical protein